MESQDAGSVAAIMAGLGIFMVFFFAFIIFFMICHWKIFTKAGKEGWKSLIPIYNMVVQLEITKQPTIWILFFFIPIVNFYFLVKHVHGLSRAFGKDVGFTVGLLFLSPIFYAILAFGDAKYVFANEDPLLNEIQEFK
jgi:hypothetical protein